MKYLLYHILCTLVNIIICFIVVKLCVFTIEYSYEDIYFTKKGDYLTNLYAFFVTFISWFSTILIYFYKKYKNHYIVLIIISVLYAVVYYFIKNNTGLHIDFIQETLPFIIIVSIAINFSQIRIGKRLLPTLYKPNKALRLKQYNMSLDFVEAAKRLGSDKEIMDSYWEYHERNQNWFFSPNPNLDGATRKPSFPSSDTWKKLKSLERKQRWNSFSLRQRMTIATLAGFGYEGRGINLDNTHHFSKLREACISVWRDDLYSVFWSDTSNGKRWLCNVFVGDAIYLYNGSSFTSANDHYYDPSQIYIGKSSLWKRDGYKDVQKGDIVVFGDYHVEIIIEIEKNWIADDGFCSIGAGRGGSAKDMGSIRCDSHGGAFGIPYLGGARELKDNNNTYFYL
ncbi:MAG: hypothetical protein OIF50_12295 [Flavobacteriaceae bacterium]|nr:hypothetical protein [Flavobacteriaceae bacterium]